MDSGSAVRRIGMVGSVWGLAFEGEGAGEGRPVLGEVMRGSRRQSGGGERGKDPHRSASLS